MNKISAKLKILIFLILAIYIAIIGTYYNSYKNTVKIIESEHSAKVEVIEKSIYNETKYSETISKIAEKDLQNDMERISYNIIDVYKSNPNVLEWDLMEMKEQFGSMDIYIINEDLEIIASSVKSEIGLSFAQLSSFSKTLKNRLEGDEFRTDSMNFSLLEGKLKKYSYMPTPDNKYLIELSITIKDKYPELDNLNIIYISKSLKDNYPFIEDIRVYRYDLDAEEPLNILGSKDDRKVATDFKTDKNLIKQAIEKGEIQQKNITIHNNDYKFKYIPYHLIESDIKMNWWDTYVIQIVYNKAYLMDSIAKQRLIFFQNLVLISLLYLGFLYMLNYTIKQHKEIAYMDYLTKLPNRNRFEKFMQIEIEESKKKGRKIAVFFFDLDCFKEINDIYGHNVGDKLLQKVAQRIKAKFPQEGIICRFGGDEFIGAISGFNNKKEITDCGKKLLEIFEADFIVDSNRMSIKSSIGISIYPDSANNIEQLISKSDAAMYYAKQNRSGCALFIGDKAMEPDI